MFSIANKTLKKVPRVPFLDIATKILGQDYDLSLVFCGDKLSHRLNNTYRQKDKPTNILSFPLDKNLGEIFLNFAKIEKECIIEEQTLAFRLAYLFIHGCLHLKGFDHGSKMEEQEEKFLKYFSISNDTQHRNRNRHRHILD